MTRNDYINALIKWNIETLQGDFANDDFDGITAILLG